MFEKEKSLREEKGSIECGKCGKSFSSKFNLKKTQKTKAQKQVDSNEEGSENDC